MNFIGLSMNPYRAICDPLCILSIWSYPVQCIIELSDRLLKNALKYHEKLVRAFFSSEVA
jgi:hypothetical protein